MAVFVEHVHLETDQRTTPPPSAIIFYGRRENVFMHIGFVALALVIAVLLVMWALVSIPMQLAAKAFMGGGTSLAVAMAAT